MYICIISITVKFQSSTFYELKLRLLLFKYLILSNIQNQMLFQTKNV